MTLQRPSRWADYSRGVMVTNAGAAASRAHICTQTQVHTTKQTYLHPRVLTHAALVTFHAVLFV